MAKQISGANEEMPRRTYDLEDRTSTFAKNCTDLCRLLQRDTINIEFISQLVRASSSVGANYREANEASSKKDFYYRIAVCRKEAKETKYWLDLVLYANTKQSEPIKILIDESMQLTRIFAAISNKK